MADSDSLIGTYLAISSTMNVLLGIGCIFFFLRMRREREKHMTQLSILYNSHLSAISRLKNASMPEEGQTINPAFHIHGEASMNTNKSANDSSQQKSTVDQIQDKSKPSLLSPWNTQKSGHVGKRNGKPNSRTNTAGKKNELGIGSANNESSDDDMPPGLDPLGNSKV